MNRKSNNPVLVSLTGLIGVLGIGWFCDALMHSLQVTNSQTFTLSYVITWVYVLVALLQAAVWLLLAWYVLVQAPADLWVSLLFLVIGLFIVIYPAIIFTPALCCWLPDIPALQLSTAHSLFSSGAYVAVIGLAGLVLRGRGRDKKTAG